MASTLVRGLYELAIFVSDGITNPFSLRRGSPQMAGGRHGCV